MREIKIFNTLVFGNFSGNGGGGRKCKDPNTEYFGTNLNIRNNGPRNKVTQSLSDIYDNFLWTFLQYIGAELILILFLSFQVLKSLF